MLAADAI